jgi:glycosyltransferase involved in cell wall biosynthesis
LQVSERISIIMPEYNVGKEVNTVLRNVKRAVERITRNYEIILIDDGSPDPPEIELDGVKVIRHEANMGKGEAIKTGVKYATGKYAVIMDADGDVDPAGIELYLRALRKCDLIVGSKRHPSSIYQAPLMRKMASIGFNMIVRLLTGIRVGDTQTGFKAFKTEQLRRIMRAAVVKRYTWDVEVLLMAKILGLRVAEAPVVIRQNSRFSLRMALSMLIELLGITYRYRIARWYQKMTK